METSVSEDFPPKPHNATKTSTESVTITKKKVLPPNLQSAEKLLEAVTERFNSFPAKKLIFTEFGLSPAAATTISPSPDNSPSPSRAKRHENLHLPAFSPLKSGSAKSHSETKIISNGSSPMGRAHCNCKQSKCLKLYCECFASGEYCDGCSCSDCHNNVETEAARLVAVEKTLLRNPNAFEPKIASNPSGNEDNEDEDNGVPMMGKHNRGCRCKRTGCLKRYCECFRANIFCSENCKCMKCKNFEGCDDRMPVCDGDKTTKLCIQQINASTSAAAGSSGYCSSAASRKRNFQELIDSYGKNSPIPGLTQHQQVNPVRASPLSVVYAEPVGQISGSAARCSSNLPDGARSSLAGIDYPAVARELCADLVTVSVVGKKCPEFTKASELASGNYSSTYGTSTVDPKFCRSEAKCEQEMLVLECLRDCLRKLITIASINNGHIVNSK